MTLGMGFKQPLRQTEGLMRSMAKRMGVEITVPDFMTFSRGGNGLSLSAKTVSKNANPLHLVLDRSGLKVFGEGAWLEQKHKKGANGALVVSCTLALILSEAKSFAPIGPRMALVNRPSYRPCWMRSTPQLTY
ncbi:transposase [Puniceibacterium antarcticum]|nr:transposase [Puniceibacterium antarcticum]